jgi:glyoxylase-like metal-dependent hydrolase (beta-lactamase superfamily II)
MRCVDLNGVQVLSLTDAAPPPAEWGYAFPKHVAEIDDPARRRWAPDGRFHTRFTVFALVHDGAVTLVDAGIGAGPSAYFGGLAGSLDREMAAAGLTPAMVSCVMLTHVHLDHVGWASRDGKPWFANARYLAPAAELEHWRRHGSEAALPHHVAAFESHVAPLLASGLLVGLTEGEAAAPAGMPLAYRALPGHTPGHAAVVLDHGPQALAIAGDSWHSPAQIERPDWCHRADRDPAAAIASRTALARWASDTGALVGAGHFPEAVGFGHIRTSESGGLAWRPLD